MIENKDWVGISIIGILTILSGISYSIQDNTYYSAERGIVMDCVRFSESGLRCYPELTNNKGYRDANDWIKLSDYVKNNGIPEIKIGKQYLCSQDVCMLIDR
jgi:hypothetical protein